MVPHNDTNPSSEVTNLNQIGFHNYPDWFTDETVKKDQPVCVS